GNSVSSSELVSTLSSPAFTPLRASVCVLPSLRRYTRDSPSGVQTGGTSRSTPSASNRGSGASMEVTHSSAGDDGLGEVRPSGRTVYANCAPSGEMEGSTPYSGACGIESTSRDCE